MTTRCAETLGISLHEAVGVLVTFWGAVSQHCVNGNIGQASDRQIELWAGWTRRRGRFAAFVHEQHTDSDGRINEWDEYQGRLETRREKDRDRQRRSRGGHADSRRDVTVTSVPTRANETIRDEQQPSSVWQPIREQRVAEQLPSVAGREALAAILHTNQTDAGKVAICAEIEACAAGERGPVFRATWPQMDLAICDYAGKYLAKGRDWEPALFRGCVRRAAAGEIRPSRQQNPGAQQVANIMGVPNGD